jgi:hypothetical protein
MLELTPFGHSHINVLTTDKGKPDQSQGRKATGPRFLREASNDSPKDPKIAELPHLPVLLCFHSVVRSSLTWESTSTSGESHESL